MPIWSFQRFIWESQRPLQQNRPVAKYKFNPPPAIQYTLIILSGALVVGLGLFFGSEIIAELLGTLRGS